MATTSDEADLPVGANGDADRSNSRNSEFVSAKLRGKFLGHAHEVFCLHVVGGAAALQTSMSLQTTMQQSPQPSILCFGDRITIQWNSTNISLHRVGNSHNKNLSTVYTHLLGVHAKPMDENNPLGASACTGFDVGFYPTDDPTRVVGDKSRQWIVMPHNGNDTNSSNGEDCHTVKVGRAALEEDAVFRAQQGTRIRIPVRSGDPVILRHCQTGGILSCNTNATTAYCGSPDTEVDGLCLLTDAHAQAQVAPAAMDEGEEVINRDGPPSLMTRLHRADRLIPSRFELFSFRQEASPAMPLWMTSSTRQGESTSSLWRNARRFSDGSYLWYPDRYQTTPATTALDKSLFSDYDDDQSNSDRRLTLYHSTLSTSQCDLLRTPQGQELLLLDEVLGACMGFEGCYVKAIVDRTNASAGGLAFCLVDDDDFRFDGISRKLVEEILPLPTYFARVRYYVCQRTPGYEYGNVMQALCKSLGRLLEKYMAEVVSWQQHFRDETLTLSGLRVQIHSTIHSLSILWQACVVVEARKGGSLINALMILKERTYEGDGGADHILAILLCDTCAPFMARLLEWLQLGVLTYDPHEEFMIVQRDVQSWENRYELSSNNILEGFFMTESIVGQVLATGRYWNALRFCENSSFDVNHDNPDLDPKGLQYGTSLAVVSAFVQTKYHQASTTLVRVMKDEFRLLEALRLMKRYFLLEHGDFFVNFLDCAEEELLKDVSQISRNRVQHWMNSCLHILEQHPPCNNVVTPLGLRCRFAADGLTDHLDRLHSASGGIDTHEAWTPMRHTYSGALGNSKGELTGLDSFYLDWVSIPFPTSIVLSQKAQECYQLLFRHLFLAKFVERRLVSIWKDHQMLKELQALRGPMGATFLLSQRMLHFIQNLIYYSMFEVVEPQWIEMEKAISTPEADKEQTVDDILEIHTLFLQRVLEACLLTNRDLVRALTKLLKTCLLFSEQMKRFMKATKIEEERNTVAVDMQKEVRHNLISRGVERSATAKQRYVQLRLQSDREARAKRVQRQSARVEREVSGEPYRRMLSRFEEVFTKNLRDFMVQLNSSNDLLHTHKTNLCIRLDYNGYITNSLGLI